MTRTALSPARLPRAVLLGGLSAALAIAFTAGAPAVAVADDDHGTETVYRFPFDPEMTTPVGGEFASEIANGKKREAAHRGHDFSFAGAQGADIPAIAAGYVRATSTEGALGNCVALEHADGAFSAYCHMDEPTPLEIGQWVDLGDPVGSVGGTPDVPVHLHLAMGWSVEVINGVGTFDPIPYIAARLEQRHTETEEPEEEAPAEIRIEVALLAATAV